MFGLSDLLSLRAIIVASSLFVLAIIDFTLTDFLPKNTLVWYLLTLVVSYLVASSPYVQDKKVTAACVNGKVVLITGASSGLGEHMAYVWAEHGARLLLCARRLERLEVVREACLAKGSPKVEVFKADFSKKDVPKKVIDFCFEKFDGVLNTMVLNHSDQRQEKLLLDHAEEELDIYQEAIDTNYVAKVKMCYHALPTLRKLGGSIGISSSGSALAANPFHTAYSSTKGAVNVFASCLREELDLMQPASALDVKPVSVTVCIIGNIETSQKGKKFREHAYSEDKAAEEMVQAIENRRDMAFVPLFVSASSILQLFPRVAGAALYQAYTKHRPEFMNALAYHREHGSKALGGLGGENYKYDFPSNEN